MPHSSVTYEFIKGLPKAELHLHLEGTLEPELKLQLARKNNIDIGQNTIEEVKATYQFDSLASFLGIYYPAMNVLQDEDDFYALAIDYLKRAKDNKVRYAELFFDPQAHTSRGVAIKDVINGYWRACQEAPNFGVEAHLIMCFLRDMSPDSAWETFQAALPYKDKFIGIGLDSDEQGNPPDKFSKVFAAAKQEGLHLSMHCDIDQNNSIEHIRQALIDIGVERLDHGTNIVENPQLVKYVKENGIGLTCCPVSNSFVVDDMKGKEILELLHGDVLVTVNSDDPAYFQSYISNDMYELAKKYNLSREDLILLAKNSFEISWIPTVKKQAFIAEIDAYVASA
jgi:adenosine deaminase